MVVLVSTRVIAERSKGSSTVAENTDMPGETDRIGCDIDADSVLALPEALLGPSEKDEPGGTILADLGVDGDGTLHLWRAICEEFGERTLGSEIDPDLFDPAMAVLAVAASRAAEITSGGHRDI
jgi:hypothetical protein